MTAQDTDTLLDLDFRPTLPCEHTQHERLHRPDGPAAWRATYRCVACGGERAPYLVCDVGKRRLALLPVTCTMCAWREAGLGLRFTPLDGSAP